ncbi:hypothetical protein F0U60_33420 [Archangium minus]|uniref:Glycerophosphoryl diester phosphodiesterase membrane domain-containing protein n=1 Tax=Archangium minus TaxID=83450 RepID=A0ABY9WZA1_9BACT|nr:hypothetical protein F0U60_33420 [Archangium minus]
MNTQPTYIRTGAVRPLECISEGWRLIRDQYLLMVGISLVGIIIASAVPFGLLQGPMMCGIYICLLALARGERIEFGTLFKGMDHFTPGLIATLVQFVPMMLVIIPTTLFFFIRVAMAIGRDGGRPRPDVAELVPGFVLTILILMPLLMALMALLLFSYPLIVDRRLSGWEACRTSARAVLGNVGGILGLILLNAVLGLVGGLLCYVGAFFVMPIGFAAIVVAYRQIFGGETG